MGNINDSLTLRLFARPSFISGVARILDLGSSLNGYNIDRSAEEADSKATSADWQMVGRDIRTAMNTHAEESE